MVSHGRDKKEAKARSQQPRRSKKKGGGNGNDVDGDDGGGDYDHDDAPDMDLLPDDYSILGGGSSVASSNDAFLDDDGGVVDGECDEERGTENSSTANRASRLSDALSLASTLTGEKRSAKREGMLRTMFKAITTYAAGREGRDVLENHWSSIWEGCSHSITGKGNAGPTEQYSACRVIEACSVILGDDRDDVVVAVHGTLRKVVNATGRSAQVRVAALRCLSMVHFVCGTDCLEEDEDRHSVMDLCVLVCAERYRGDKTPPSLRAAALDCWSLLGTTLHDGRIAAGDADDGDVELGRGLTILPLLANCLDSSDAGLRRSAGEAVSLIHECRLRMGLDEYEADNATERKFRRGSWDGSEWEVMMDEVRQRMSELSVESSHHMSRQAKKEQRSTFRDFVRTIVDDEYPDEVVNWKGGKLTLGSWKGIVQLNFVRHCLQGGFQAQLMTNETLHAIFGSALTITSGSSLSQIEKRMYLSKTSEASKAADRVLAKQRRTRTNVKNHFLTSDGEDM